MFNSIWGQGGIVFFIFRQLWWMVEPYAKGLAPAILTTITLY